MPREGCKCLVEWRVGVGRLDKKLGNAVFACNLKPRKATENWIHIDSNPKGLHLGPQTKKSSQLL